MAGITNTAASIYNVWSGQTDMPSARAKPYLLSH